jgi:hypothetical protein
MDKCELAPLARARHPALCGLRGTPRPCSGRTSGHHVAPEDRDVPSSRKSRMPGEQPQVSKRSGRRAESRNGGDFKVCAGLARGPTAAGFAALMTLTREGRHPGTVAVSVDEKYAARRCLPTPMGAIAYLLLVAEQSHSRTFGHQYAKRMKAASGGGRVSICPSNYRLSMLAIPRWLPNDDPPISSDSTCYDR